MGPADRRHGVADGPRARAARPPRIGQHAEGFSSLCLIGSAPGILLGQPGLETHDLDVWEPDSDCDEVTLRRACHSAGIEVYTDGEERPLNRASYIEVIEPGVSARIRRRAYVQIIQRHRECAVDLPPEFPVITLGQFGQLLVFAPEPALIVALKLGRGKPQDIDDAQWLVTARGLSQDAIRAAIATLPRSAAQAAAARHLARLP